MFRDGCKRAGILTTHVDKKAAPIAGAGLERGEIVSIDDNVIGKKRKLVTGCGSLHCLAFFDPETGALLETYLSKGSTGGCNNFMIGLSRMISISARAGIDALIAAVSSMRLFVVILDVFLMSFLPFVAV